MKEREFFKAYWTNGPVPVMPKEKWDRVEQYLEYLRHLAAYVLLAEPFVGDKKVLEIGCGTGYGANYLSKSACSIVAIDVVKGAISYCQDKYVKDNLVFKQADGLNLPFKDESFDVVLSFQAIEHIEPQNVFRFLSEVKRTLKQEGIFLVSTPNSRLRLLPFQKPWNPEHKKEYKDEDFKDLLSQVFGEVKVYGLRGSDEIQTIERNRVKQRPLRAYIIRPVYRVLSNLLLSSMLIRLKKVDQYLLARRKGHSSILEEALTTKFSLNDFTVDRTCPKDCLDLYGICAKAKN